MTSSSHRHSFLESLEGRVCLSASISIDQMFGFQVWEHDTLGPVDRPDGFPYLAKFHGDGIAFDPTEFQAKVDWHDGTTSTAAIEVVPAMPYAPATLAVAFGENKTFGDWADMTYTLTISEVGHPEVAASADAVYWVNDHPINGIAVDAFANNGSNGFRNVTVGKFDDGWADKGITDPLGKASDYSAVINWGDGTKTVGTIVADKSLKGRYSVVGSHTYNSLKAQTYPATVSISQTNGGYLTGTAWGSATIYNAPVIKPITVTTAPGSLFSTTQVTDVWA
jgi:hypothetical protein